MLPILVMQTEIVSKFKRTGTPDEWNYQYSDHHYCMKGDPKFLELLKKNLFKIFVQVWNFSPLQSILPVTGYSDPSIIPTAGNTV